MVLESTEGKGRETKKHFFFCFRGKGGVSSTLTGKGNACGGGAHEAANGRGDGAGEEANGRGADGHLNGTEERGHETANGHDEANDLGDGARCGHRADGHLNGTEGRGHAVARVFGNDLGAGRDDGGHDAANVLGDGARCGGSGRLVKASVFANWHCAGAGTSQKWHGPQQSTHGRHTTDGNVCRTGSSCWCRSP